MSKKGEAVRLISVMHECIGIMMRNADFVVKETSSLAADEPLRSEITGTCRQLSDTLMFDVRGEMRAIEDKLGLASEPDSYSNRDPGVNAQLITSWVGTAIDDLNRLIQSLPESTEQPAQISLSILLRESGTNILVAYKRLCDAAEAVKKLHPVNVDESE